MYDSATWFPICAGLTAVGVVAAFFALRRRGAASALRLLGWAALPMAIYLTGLVRLFWTIGSELVKWITGFVLNPLVWTGLALFAFTAVALPVAAMMRRRQGTKPAVASAGAPATASTDTRQIEAAGQSGVVTGKESARKKRAKAKAAKGGDKGAKADKAEPDESMEDIDEILKRHGIS